MKNSFLFSIIILITICLFSCRENPSKSEMSPFIESIRMNNEEKQLLEINKLTKKYPNSYITFANRLNVLLSIKDIDSAIENCLHMIKIQPNNALIKVQLGMLYIIDNNNGNAEFQLKNGLSLLMEDYKNENDINKKRSIAINLYIPLALLNRTVDAEEILNDFNSSLTENEIDILNKIRNKSPLDISKTLCNYY